MTVAIYNYWFPYRLYCFVSWSMWLRTFAWRFYARNNRFLNVCMTVLHVYKKALKLVRGDFAFCQITINVLSRNMTTSFTYLDTKKEDVAGTSSCYVWCWNNGLNKKPMLLYPRLALSQRFYLILRERTSVKKGREFHDQWYKSLLHGAEYIG